MIIEMDFFTAANLVLIRTFLKEKEFTITERFGMGEYKKQTQCGFVACAIGYSPNAGIEKFENESWYYYSERVFPLDKKVKDFLFSHVWGVTKFRGPLDVVNRIDWVLDAWDLHVPLESLCDGAVWSVFTGRVK